MTPECQHCGAFVTQQYVRVFAPDDKRVECCPHCEDRKRGGMSDDSPDPQRKESHDFSRVEDVNDKNFETVKLSVTVKRDFEVPVDVLTQREISSAELESRAEDYFWGHWNEFLTNDPPQKSDVSLVSSIAPHTTDGARRCTECGKSVEDAPYELWLFHICRTCAEANAMSDARGGDR